MPRAYRGGRMGSKTVLTALTSTADAFAKIDQARLIRKSLGEESLEGPIKPILEELKHKLEFAQRYAPFVHDSYVTHVHQQLQAAINALNEQAQRQSAGEYIANKQALLNNLNTWLESVKVHWAPFVTAAVESRGFLEDEGIRKEYERTLANMQAETRAALENVRKESTAAIEEARKLAEQIESRARKTATKISVDEAQAQFRAAENHLRGFVFLWAGLSVVALAILAALLYRFLDTKLPDGWTWQVAFHAAMRFAALATVGSVAAYCMGVLKAQLHQYLLNQHRQRVTNSISAFVESAVTPEQRDLILGHLVESVVSFGHSGLLPGQTPGEGTGPKLTVDNITRSMVMASKDAAK